MSQGKEHERQHIINRIIDLVAESLSPDEVELVTQFALLYYAASTVEDLRDRAVEDLYGSMLALWRLGRQRQPRQVLIRVCNPDFEQHGWQSTHTVVEVITDDIPFLVDSLSMVFVRLELMTHLVMHPVLQVSRDKKGCITKVLPQSINNEGLLNEAILHFEVDRQTDNDALSALQAEVEQVLADVCVVVEDWAPMREKIKQIIPVIEAQALPLSDAEIQESLAFLRWMENHHFTFIGFRAYDLVEEEGQDVLRLVGVLLELLAQLDDEVVDGAVARVGIEPPDLREDLVTGHGLTLPFEQQAQ